jgi:hypothetical protein
VFGKAERMGADKSGELRPGPVYDLDMANPKPRAHRIGSATRFRELNVSISQGAFYQPASFEHARNGKMDVNKAAPFGAS